MKSTIFQQHRLAAARGFSGLSLLVACGTALASPATTADSSPRNSLFIAPYVWAPNFEGSIGFGKLEVPLDFKAQELAVNVNAAAMGYAQYSRDEHFVYVEGLGIRFSDREFAEFFGQRVDAELTLAEAGYGQHFEFTPAYPAEGKIVVSPYIGLRYASLKAVVGDAPRGLAASEHWIDPALGVIVFGPLLRNLGYALKFDAAGFGLGKDHYLSGIVALQYRFAQRWSIGLGLRSSHFNAEPGGSNDLTLDLHATGPEAGLSYTFSY